MVIGAATFEEGGNQGVAFVLDLTERKRAEQALTEIRRVAYQQNNAAKIKALLASAGAIRAQWAARGVAEGEFEQVTELERQAWELGDKSGATVDSLYR